MPRIKLTRRGWAGMALAAAGATDVEVHAGFPAGNIRVERVDGSDVYVRQDLRDTVGDWFWWCFGVRGAQGRALRFRFTGSDVIGVRGPAVSDDAGRTWRWLGREAVENKTFSYSFGRAARETRFAFAMPYTEANLEEFLRDHPAVRVETLAMTRKGRRAELLRFGCLDASARRRVLLTARHHACECMASYALEGLILGALAGQRLASEVEFLVVPFVDKDGVEDGDQGKNRRPRDHNRDYSGESVHPTVRAIRERVPAWSQGRLAFALDLHCPWIRGDHNEDVYFPGGPDPRIWAEIVRFAGWLERLRRGPIPYAAKHNLPFGTAWNTAANFTQGMSFSRWAGQLEGVRAAGTLEIPYANASGAEVNASSLRALGEDLARALEAWLGDLG